MKAKNFLAPSGACLRVVGEVGEVALNGSFVGKYHIVLIYSYVPKHFRFYVAMTGKTEKASQAKISSKILRPVAGKYNLQGVDL